jgi:hypothetical protein
MLEPMMNGASRRATLRDRALWRGAAPRATEPLTGLGLTVTIGWRRDGLRRTRLTVAARPRGGVFVAFPGQARVGGAPC